MPVTNYDTLHGEIIAEYTDGVQLDYLKDALGSVTAWVDQNCNIVATARYKPFGDILVSTGTLGRFTWVGTLGYRTTGLTWADKYVRARHYGSKQGQWTTVDPLWPKQEGYIYADASPGSRIDPTGLIPCGGGIEIPAIYGRYCGPQTTKDKMVIVRGKPFQVRGISETDECCRVHDNCFSRYGCTFLNQIFKPECTSCTQDLCACFQRNRPSLLDVLRGDATWEEFYWNGTLASLYCRWPFTGLLR